MVAFLIENNADVHAEDNDVIDSDFWKYSSSICSVPKTHYNC